MDCVAGLTRLLQVSMMGVVSRTRSLSSVSGRCYSSVPAGPRWRRFPFPSGSRCRLRLGSSTGTHTLGRFNAVPTFGPVPSIPLRGGKRSRLSRGGLGRLNRRLGLDERLLHLFGIPLDHPRREILAFGPVADRLEQAEPVFLILLLDPGEEGLARLRRAGPIAGGPGARWSWLCLGKCVRRRMGMLRRVGGQGGMSHALVNEARHPVAVEVAANAELDRRALEGVGEAALVVITRVRHPRVAAGI